MEVFSGVCFFGFGGVLGGDWDSGLVSILGVQLCSEVDMPVEHKFCTSETPASFCIWRIYALWRAKVPMDQRAEKLERGRRLSLSSHT